MVFRSNTWTVTATPISKSKILSQEAVAIKIMLKSRLHQRKIKEVILMEGRTPLYTLYSCKGGPRYLFSNNLRMSCGALREKQ